MSVAAAVAGVPGGVTSRSALSRLGSDVPSPGADGRSDGSGLGLVGGSDGSGLGLVGRSDGSGLRPDGGSDIVAGLGDAGEPTSGASPELLLLLLADARLPTAGHTQSGQLEPAITHGLSAADVPAFIDLRLASVTRVEAGAAVVALHHLRQGLPLAPVEAAWAARTPSSAMRATSRSMARGLLRITRRLWPGHPGLESLAAPEPGPSRAVVLAAAADACGLSPLALARLVGYDDVQTVAAASLKLIPLDPALVATWVLGALPAVERMAADVALLTQPGQIPATGAPLIEAWAQAHASAPRRLFSA